MENQGTPNQETVNQQFNQQFGQQQIPNSTASLVLGIISIPVCFCYFLFGIPGLILSIIALIQANKGKKIYEENPSLYTQASFNNLKAGRVCAIVGLCLNSLCFLGMIIYVIFAVSVASAIFSGMPWDPKY